MPATTTRENDDREVIEYEAVSGVQHRDVTLKRARETHVMFGPQSYQPTTF